MHIFQVSIRDLTPKLSLAISAASRSYQFYFTFSRARGAALLTWGDSYKFSCWQFNLDRVFAEFESDSYGYQLNTDFITQRLKDQLPHASRSILAWASLIGSRFSFSLIQRFITTSYFTVYGPRINSLKLI